MDTVKRKPASMQPTAIFCLLALTYALGGLLPVLLFVGVGGAVWVFLRLAFPPVRRADDAARTPAVPGL